MYLLLWFIVFSFIFLSTVWSKNKKCTQHDDCILSCSGKKRIFIYSACYCHDKDNCECDECKIDNEDEDISGSCPTSTHTVNINDLEQIFRDCTLKQSCNVTKYSNTMTTTNINNVILRISYGCEGEKSLFKLTELDESINRPVTVLYHDGEFMTEPIDIECTILPEANKKMNIYVNLIKISENSSIRVEMIGRTINQSYTSGRFVYRYSYRDIKHQVNLSFALYTGYDDIISIVVTSKKSVNINCNRYSITTPSTPTTSTPTTSTSATLLSATSTATTLIPATSTTSTSTPTTSTSATLLSATSTATTLLPATSTTSTEMPYNQPVNSPSAVGRTVGWTVGVIVVVVIVVVCIVIVIIVRKKRICNSSKSNVGGITDRINMDNETSHDYEAPDEHYYQEVHANFEDTLTACNPPSGSVQDKTTEDDYDQLGNQDKSTNGNSAMLNSHQDDYNHINLTNNSNSDKMPPDSDVYKHLNQVKSDNSAMNNLNPDYDHLPVTSEDSYQTLGQETKDSKHDPNYDHFQLKSSI